MEQLMDRHRRRVLSVVWQFESGTSPVDRSDVVVGNPRSRWYVRGRQNLAAAFLLALLSSLVLGCEREPQGRKVRLSVAPQAPVREQPATRVVPLRVAVAPVISPRENVGLYRPLLEHVSSRLGRPVDLLQRRTYAEVNDLLRYGHADVAFICDYAFVEGELSFGMQILVVPIVMGKRMYQSYIIVPKESDAQDIADLEGKSFAFSDPLSSSGWLFPTHLLNQIGQEPEFFFRRHVFTYSHDSTVKAVAQRLVDGGAVDSLVYDFMLAKDPAYRQKTKVIQESSPWGNPPVVVHPHIDATLREEIKEVFLDVHLSKEGQAVLAPLMINRFIPPNDSSYDPVRQMAEEARGRIGQTGLKRLRASMRTETRVENSTKVEAP
ncbi:MAG: substrate-binding domain-containing protein [Planctomycetota bacterium]|jgi:phosphonate transport system substrate-binding protein